MGVLVMLHRGVQTVVVRNAVVGAELNTLNSTVVDCLQQFSRRAPGTPVCVGWHEGAQHAVHCFSAGVSLLVAAHPLKVHEEQLAQNNIGRWIAFWRVHRVGPRRHGFTDRVGRRLVHSRHMFQPVVGQSLCVWVIISVLKVTCV